MVITVYLHMDRADDGTTSWWAESPSIEGFSAAADSMNELCARVQVAIADLVDDGEVAPGEVVFKLGASTAATANPTRVDRSDQTTAEGTGRPQARVLVG